MTGWTDSYGAGSGDLWLIKTDSLGSKVWDKTFGGKSFDIGFSVKQTTDGGYIVTGCIRDDSTGDSDVLLLKTDADGN
jgi:hypothetical protein